MSDKFEFEVMNGPEIEELLKGFSGWQNQDGALQKTYHNDSFLEAIAFVNRVAVAAEKLNHHPDFTIHYKQVTLRCWTHIKHAITRADIELVKAIESVA